MARWLVVAGILGGLGVACGAFGVHALAGGLPPDRLSVFETAVRYVLMHALALLAVAWLASRPDAGRAAAVAGWAFAGVGLVVATDLAATWWKSRRKQAASLDKSLLDTESPPRSELQSPDTEQATGLDSAENPPE